VCVHSALKTKHDTPKYGLIYHASLIGQAAPKNKGKISRVLAAKAALSIRVDALGDKDTAEIGTENRLKVEQRLRQLEGKARLTLSGSGKGKTATPKYGGPARPVATYNTAADSTLPSGKKAKAAQRPAAEVDNGAAMDEDDATTPAPSGTWVVSLCTAKAEAARTVMQCIESVFVSVPCERQPKREPMSAPECCLCGIQAVPGGSPARTCHSRRARVCACVCVWVGKKRVREAAEADGAVRDTHGARMLVDLY
jgi:hypothetical protein